MNGVLIWWMPCQWSDVPSARYEFVSVTLTMSFTSAQIVGPCAPPNMSEPFSDQRRRE